MLKNELGQPIGYPVKNWKPATYPTGSALTGERCRLERLDPGVHASDLYNAYSLDTENRGWTYLPYGPFHSAKEYRQWIRASCQGDDPLFYAVLDKVSGRAEGVSSYLRISASDGVIEVGHINYSLLMQNTAKSTEAMYLMMRHVFDDLKYRRYEWKCDALNSSSRKAALRLGFTFEGIFRQATMYKGRNRDTAWYSIVDAEWPSVKNAHQKWLASDNFMGDQQRQSLPSLMPKNSADEA